MFNRRKAAAYSPAPATASPFHVRWDQGTRDQQEDNWTIARSPNGARLLFVIADGLGGQASGEVASRALVTAMQQSFNDGWALPPAEVLRKGRDGAAEALKNVQGNAATTLVAAIAERDERGEMKLTCLWVGDCRAYLATPTQHDPGPDAIPVWPSSSRKDAKLWLLTKDHSLVWSLFESGERTLDEIASHPMRNQVQASVDAGGQHSRDAVAAYSVLPEDRLLFCTDGVWEALPVADLARVLLSPNPLAECHQQLERLLEEGLLDGKVSDNNTYILAEAGRAIFQSPLPRSEDMRPPRKRWTRMHLVRLALLLSLPVFILLVILYHQFSPTGKPAPKTPSTVSPVTQPREVASPTPAPSATPSAPKEASSNKPPAGAAKHEEQATEPKSPVEPTKPPVNDIQKQPAQPSIVPVPIPSKNVPPPVVAPSPSENAAPPAQPPQPQTPPTQPGTGVIPTETAQSQPSSPQTPSAPPVTGQTLPGHPKEETTPKETPGNKGEPSASQPHPDEKSALNEKEQKKLGKELIEAAKNRDTKKVEELLAKGANPNFTDNKEQTPLMKAAYGGYQEVCALLIDKGADVNAKDKYGFTALMYAAKNGHKDICDLLLSKGADINAQDKDGKTALKYAIENKKDDVADFLRSKGAKE